MGLYIKDLDLPGAIEPELVMDFAVGLDGKVYARYYHHWEGGLTDWKEVISIPDHGDLIDRDVLLGETEDVWEMSARYSDGGFSRFLIECEPVVIPREGKE